MKSAIEHRREAIRAVKAAREIQTVADIAKRPLSTEENEKILSLLDDGKHALAVAAAQDAVAAPTWTSLEEASKVIADLERPSPRLTTSTGPAWTDAERDAMAGGHNLIDAAPAPVRPAKSMKYYDLFPAAPKTLSGFRSSSEFFDVVGYGQAHPALRPSAVMSGQTGASGGYLIPSPIAAAMWDAAVQSSVLLPKVSLFAMESDTLRVCAWDETTLTDTVDAGFTLEFLGELASATRSTGTMRAIVLNAHRAAIYVQASGELVQDGQNFESQLTAKIQSALSRGIDITILRGDGAAKPLGILNAPCTISVAKESGQVAATILYENVVKMYSRMLPSSVANAVWLVHPGCLPQLLSMTLGVGAAGVFFPVLDQSNGSMSLLGRPVVLTEACSALGTVGDIVFADLSAVLMGMRQGITLERSIEPGWLTNAVDWRCQIRCDAQPALANPIATARGASMSPFVTLATRA